MNPVHPLVSIVIPVYNGSNYLREAIDCALSQTYQNVEIIVVNDGSTDDGKTEKLALSYGDRIRYYKKENGGVATALNYGISVMKGEWFSWLSHDDLYAPDKIKKQIEAINNSQIVPSVVRTNTISIDFIGNKIFRPQKKKKGLFDGLEMMKLHLLKEIGLYGCTLLINKRTLDECGPFNTELKLIQDEEYWLRIMLLKNSHFLSIDDELVKIRVHAGQATNRLKDRFALEQEKLANYILERFLTNKALYNHIIVFILKQAKEGNTKIKRELLDKIKLISKIKFKDKVRICIYSIYGFFYRLVKRIYRLVYVKRIRKQS